MAIRISLFSVILFAAASVGKLIQSHFAFLYFLVCLLVKVHRWDNRNNRSTGVGNLLIIGLGLLFGGEQWGEMNETSI